MAITRFKNSSIVNNGPKYNDFQAGIPFRPVIGTATNVGTSRPYNDGAATVSFTANNTDSSVTYTATSSPGGFTGSGSSSPVTVTGLQSATAYTFTVAASDSDGASVPTAASNSITATTVPQAPTIGTATAGNANASVTFTANATGGSAITSYTATSSPGNITGTGSASPITVSGLTNGTAYTFSVTATNANGTSAASAASNSVTPVVPGAFDSIASATPSGTNTVTFSNIPQTYAHLQLRTVMRSTEGVNNPINVGVRINGVSSSIYEFGYLDGTNGGISTSAGDSSSWPWLYAGSSNFSNFVSPGIADFIDYTDTNKNKSARFFSGGTTLDITQNRVTMTSGIFNSTSAISSITIFLFTGNFMAGSVISLYGIAGS